MPIYDYVCRNCGHVLEVIHPVDAAGPSECPVCGGAMRRALSAPAIVFKGSGWAKKDARASAAKSAPAREAADSAKGKPETTKADGAASTTGDKAAPKTASPEAS